MKRALAVILLAVGLSGCVSIHPQGTGRLGCPDGYNPMQVSQIVFGRNLGAVLGVSQDQWMEFLAAEVTPRFPDGLTVIDANGQWRGADNVIVQEPSKIVLIVHSGSPADLAKVEAIRSAYKTRFRQEAVLVYQVEQCVAF